MTLIVILVFLMLMTLFAVSVLHRIQRRQRQRRLEQRRLRIQVEELTDVVTCLEQTLPNRVITKLINDMIIALQHQMLTLEDNNREHLEAAIQKSEHYSEELLNPKNRQGISYQRDSDAQIAKTQLHINEALNLIVQLAAHSTINEIELGAYQTELRWAYLMVSVMSYIGQGDKSVAISDRLAFYRKAQHLLMESMHQDPRRLQMIKELSEMIDGERVGLSSALREMAPVA
jgi:hypothetical protein